MERYTLEKHLKNICNDDYEFCNLHETWRLNKTSSEKILKSVHINFPHYSLHDSSHSETIISNIEMLLGEDRIKQLSPTETWMILQCAYLHDLGMAITNKCLEEQWESEEFKEYLKESKEYSVDKDLIEAITYIENLKHNLKDNLSTDSFSDMCIWPLKIRRYTTYIIADYFRGKHSSFSQEYIKDTLSQWSIDLSYNDIIKKRLIDLIGKISFLHTGDSENIMKLEYISNGHRSDYIHPRFIAILLRLGDLFDTDNGRFDNFMEKINGELPHIASIHKKKHQSITHILVTPEKIELESDCEEDEVCRATKEWFEWIQKEINNLTMKWSEIVPKNLTGYAPKITKLKILLNGQEDVSGLTDLKFNVSQEKAFDIIQGANIYDNKFVFVRELIQNALDASKIQLWRDLKSGVYDFELDDFLKEKKELKELIPFHLHKTIYDRYKIHIDIKDDKEDANNEIEFIIRDSGTGINIESLKDLCKVGTSYKNRRKEIEEMPSWLRPTGGFGIGLQSIFLVTSKFEAYTNTNDNKSYKITFESRKSNGYITVREEKLYRKRGTEIHVKINKNMPFENSGVNPDDVIYIDSNNTIGGCILKQILDCKNNLLEIETTEIKITQNGNEEKETNQYYDYDHSLLVYKDEDKNKEDKNDKDDKNKKDYLLGKFNEEDNRYAYFLNNDLNYMKIYDKKESINVNIKISSNDKNLTNSSPNSYYFKGIKLKGIQVTELSMSIYNSGIDIQTKVPNRMREFIEVSVDILGKDTKEYLNLDRNAIKEDKLKEIGSLIDDAISFYLRTVAKEYVNYRKQYKFNEFLFIMLCLKYLDDFKPTEYKNIIDRINDSYKIEVLEKNTKNEIVVGYKLFKDIIMNYPNWAYIDSILIKNLVGDLSEWNKKLSIHINNEKINIFEDINLNYVIIGDLVNDIFMNEIRISNKFKFGKLRYLFRLDKEDIILYSINSKDKFSLNGMDNQTIEYYLGLLIEDKSNSTDINKRSTLPTIKGYEDLAVRNLPMDVQQKYFNIYNIISPLTINEIKDLYECDNIDEFITTIEKKDSFLNLINYTLKNKVTNDEKTFSEIANKYKELIRKCFDLIQSEKS